MRLIEQYQERERIIATFGQARLIKQNGGRYEIKGGSDEDKVAAKEWISLFLHEAVPKMRP
jgi:hypothetical protein